MAFAKIIDLDAVKLILQKWGNAVLNPAPAPEKQIPVVFDWQAGTKPLKPFMSYRTVGAEKRTVTEDVIFQQDGLPYLAGNRVYKVEVECFSDDEVASEMIEALRESFEQPQFYSIIERGSASLTPTPAIPFECSVAEVRDPVDLTDLLDTKYERRTMLEFELVVSAVAPIVDGTPSGDGIAKVDTIGIAKDGTGAQISMEVDADNS